MSGGGYYFLVDFNGTLVHHERGGKVVDDDGKVYIGPPIPGMVARVRKLLDRGTEVRIMCGTVGEGGPKGEAMAKAIRAWCKEHLGRELEPTGTITTKCLMIWNDKAKEVIRNEGRFRHDDDGEGAAPAGPHKPSQAKAREMYLDAISRRR